MSSGEYYNHTTFPTTSSALSSSAMRSELDSITSGISAKLPDLSGNGGEILAVNAGATALEAITTTGTGSGVRATSPTLVTPVLGVATATSINGLTITTSTGTLTITNGKTLSVSNTLTFTGTDASSVAFGTGGTVTYTSNDLSVFAATTSAQLAGVISNETGSGLAVFNDTPTLIAPALGAATATSINGLTITTSTGTLTITNGKTLTNTNSITLTGTDAQTYTFPTTSATLARTDTAQTFTGAQLFDTRVVGANTATAPTHLLANFIANQNINEHAWYAFIDESTLDYTGTASAPPVGHASFNDRVTITGTQGFDHHHSFQSYPTINLTGTLARFSSFWSLPTVTSGTITEFSEFKASDPTQSGGTITNLYGLYVEELTKGGTLNRAIRTAGTTLSSFNGGVELGPIGSAATIISSASTGDLEIDPRSTYKTNFRSGNVQISSGTLTVSSTVTPQALLDISGASAGQVKFPATQNASSDANTLDDYEEGTWTASVGGTATYTLNTGTYTKVGRQVTARVSFIINLIGSGSTSVISGLPFTSAAITPGSVGYFDTLATNVLFIGCYVGTSTTLSFVSATAATATATNVPAIFGNSSRVDASVTYFV